MLDEDTANILVQRIGNIESGAWVATSVTYFATLDYAGIPSGSGTEIAGAYEFTLPMTGLAQVAGSVPVSVSVRLEAGLEILGVLSPTHAISVDQGPESGRTITMGAPVSASTRDFVLRYAVAAPTPRVGVITQRGSSGTYFSMLITPPVSTRERAPLEVAVVADITAETTPAQIQAYRAAAAALLGKLTPTDRFLVASPGGASGVFEPATADAIAAAIARIGPAAGTDRALDASIRDALLPVATTSRLVCVLGRGEISGGVQALREARANLQSARIFAVSIDEPAGFAFESLSRIGRGGVIHLSSDPAASAGNDAIMSRLLDREGSPVMTDLEIDWGGAEVVDVFPRRLPNLSAGRPVHIVGKLLSPPTAGREIRVTGTVRGASGVRRETLTATWNTATPAPGAIPTLWARAKVLMLSEQLAAGSADADGVRREIVELALRHNLVSAMTSFISVDALSSVPPAVRPVPRVEQATNALPR
jgi:Ca-activated chloride channel family protein